MEKEKIITANNLKLGTRIKLLRTNQKRTLQEIADNCGLSKSMISKIENNKIIPSVASLVKIAATLGTSISELLQQESCSKTIVTSQKIAMEKLVKTEKGYMIFPYASEYHDKKMQPFLFVAQKGEIIPHQLSHEGEEFIFVIEGSMKMQVGEAKYILKSGDGLYFNAMNKHGIIPITDKVIYINIFA